MEELKGKVKAVKQQRQILSSEEEVSTAESDTYQRTTLIQKSKLPGRQSSRETRRHQIIADIGKPEGFPALNKGCTQNTNKESIILPESGMENYYRRNKPRKNVRVFRSRRHISTSDSEEEANGTNT